MKKRTVANRTLISAVLSVLLILCGGGAFGADFNRFSIGVFPGVAFSFAVVSAMKHLRLASQLLFIGLSVMLYLSMFAGCQYIDISLKYLVVFPIMGAIGEIVIIHFTLFSFKRIWFGLVRGFIIGVYSLLPLVSIYFLWVIGFLFMPFSVIIWQERMGNYIDEMIYKYGDNQS